MWDADHGDDTVTRIGLATRSEMTIQVGHGPTGIAVGADAVWVANSDEGTVMKIDPVDPRHVETIVIGNRPAGIAVANGGIWVTVQATT